MAQGEVTIEYTYCPTCGDRLKMSEIYSQEQLGIRGSQRYFMACEKCWTPIINNHEESDKIRQRLAASKGYTQLFGG